GAHRRDDRLHAGVDETQRVEVALDDEHALVAPRRLSRPVQSVEQPALAEDRRLGRVQILRLSGPEQPSAEADDTAGDVVDREHEPPAKARARLDPFVRHDDEAGRDHPLLLEAEGREISAQQPDLAWRESESDAIGELTAHAALLEVGARVAPEVVVPEHAAEVI